MNFPNFADEFQLYCIILKILINDDYFMMKILTNAIIFLTLASLWACSDSEEERMRFANAYKDILITRELHADTLKANAEVKKIIRKYGYTDAEFKNKFFEYAQDRNEFIRLLDSIRTLATHTVDSLGTDEIPPAPQVGNLPFQKSPKFDSIMKKFEMTHKPDSLGKKAIK